jgi:hypothetical protein
VLAEGNSRVRHTLFFFFSPLRFSSFRSIVLPVKNLQIQLRVLPYPPRQIGSVPSAVCATISVPVLTNGALAC